MRSISTRIAGLAAAAAVVVGIAAPAAGAMPINDRVSDHPVPEPSCAAWAQAMSSSLALYGITGAQADSYLASRADNPCGTPLTLRSLFHAGDA